MSVSPPRDDSASSLVDAGDVEPTSKAPRLADRIPTGPLFDSSVILDRFMRWIGDISLVAYPAQEEALLELSTGQHVILSTPTGSGKSLVAQGLHFKARCEGKRSFYTAPIKALVNEKFFDWCDQFGAENVGMLTGDASINRDAPIICCTAEILANMAVSEGAALDAPYVVMDEFHYFGDRDRGMAWQLPLLELPNTQYLLMSATLGDTRAIEGLIKRRSTRSIVRIHNDDRPVPLDFSYRETPVHETVEKLLAQNLAPIYIVHFTQRECADQAQALTSSNISDKQEKRALAQAMIGFRFDTPYGKDMQRFLRHGIGIHHAGLLPKYRLLVERLAQRGLLKVICGTDTLGVGVNIPIRTVLFSKLCKFDGQKVGILSVREFLQISGRAGRKGFDSAGSVVCQAPEHVIENKRLEAKAAGALAGGASARKKKKRIKKKSPSKGYVAWDRETLTRLSTSPPEPLVSRFHASVGLLVNCLKSEAGPRDRGAGYGHMIDLIGRSLEDLSSKHKLVVEAAVLFRALRSAGILELETDPRRKGSRVRVSQDLQPNFSLHHALSLYLVEVLEALDSEGEERALDVLALVESILENPRALLIAQERRLKSELMAKLKAEGVAYEERIEKLDRVSWPKPNAEFIYRTFNMFADKHPWVGESNIRPKAIARELFESYSAFNDFVKLNQMARIEGVLLRYLSQVHNTLSQTIPDAHKTSQILEMIAYFRTLLSRVDASLLEEWEDRMNSDRDPGAKAKGERAVVDPPTTLDKRAFDARVRSELHHLMRCIAKRDYEGATTCVHQDRDDPWDVARFEEELLPFYDEYEAILFQPSARQAHLASIKELRPGIYEARQVLSDDVGDNLWNLEAEVHVDEPRLPDGPLLRLRRIGT
jgi:superfamily II RNA helicase